MPPELIPYLPYLQPVACAAGGLLAGWLLTRMAQASARARLEERLKAGERQAADLEARLVAAEEEADEIERTAQGLRNQVIEYRVRLEEEVRSGEERQALVDHAERRFADTFKALSADALRSSSEQFLQLARTSLRSQTEEVKGDLDQRRAAIEHLMQPVAESLGRFETRVGEIEKARVGAYIELQTQVRSLAEGQAGLRQETALLVRALRQPAGRGQWGEMQLRRVVELAGMQEHCDFQMQAHATDDEGRRLRPDLLAHLPGGRVIVVDAKAPMDAYLDALEAADDRARAEALLRHARQVRTHIAQLSSKNYAAQFDSAPEFTVLFLPSEAIFSAALEADPALIEQGVERNVILATPTTLIALLRAVASGWRQEALAENAREIALLGRTLHERLGTLTGHFARLGKSLESAVGHYNAASGCFETRVLVTARKLEALEAATPGEALPELTPVDSFPRAPSTSVAEEIPVPALSPAAPPATEVRALSAASDLRLALEE